MDIILKKYTILCTGLILLLTGCSRSGDENNNAVENNFYELRIYDAAPGKLDDLHARFRDHTLNFFEKHNITSIGYWVPIDNPENRLYYIIAFPSREARESSWEAFATDPDWIDARADSEVDGRLVTNVQSIYLSKTDYSPDVTPAIANPPRLFELRTYKATGGNLGHLHARFRDHTIDLFSKHGMEHFGYWNPLDVEDGADDTLIYIISHKDTESRDASFNAFRSDPDWISAKEASEAAAGGSLTESVESILMKATDYSLTN